LWRGGMTLMRTNCLHGDGSIRAGNWAMEPRLVPVGVIGKDGTCAALSDLTNPKPDRLPAPRSEPMPSAITASKPPKMIEVELRSGTRIRIDGVSKAWRFSKSSS